MSSDSFPVASHNLHARVERRGRPARQRNTRYELGEGGLEGWRHTAFLPPLNHPSMRVPRALGSRQNFGLCSVRGILNPVYIGNSLSANIRPITGSPLLGSSNRRRHNLPILHLPKIFCVIAFSPRATADIDLASSRRQDSGAVFQLKVVGKTHGSWGATGRRPLSQITRVSLSLCLFYLRLYYNIWQPSTG